MYRSIAKERNTDKLYLELSDSQNLPTTKVHGMIRIENMRENTEGNIIGSEKKKKSEKKEIKKLRYK